MVCVAYSGSSGSVGSSRHLSKHELYGVYCHECRCVRCWMVIWSSMGLLGTCSGSVIEIVEGIRGLDNTQKKVGRLGQPSWSLSQVPSSVYTGVPSSKAHHSTCFNHFSSFSSFSFFPMIFVIVIFSSLCIISNRLHGFQLLFWILVCFLLIINFCFVYHCFVF